MVQQRIATTLCRLHHASGSLAPERERVGAGDPDVQKPPNSTRDRPRVGVRVSPSGIAVCGELSAIPAIAACHP